MANGSSQSTNTCPPHSPTRTTNNSILNPAGAFHEPNTSSIRFWAFSYSAGEPCGRSNQLIMYFIAVLLIVLVLGTIAVWPIRLQQGPEVKISKLGIRLTPRGSRC